MSDEELFSVWMLEIVKKRKSMEISQYDSLRKVVKTGGADVVQKFGETFKELKVEGHRSKEIDTLYMGSESASRKRFQQKESSGYNGRSFSRSRMGQFDRGNRSGSRGRQDWRKNVGRPSNDRSRSRLSNNRSRSRPSDDRSRSRGKTSGEYARCIGCKCKSCEETRKIFKDLADVLGKEKVPIKVNLCEEE